MSDVYAAGDNLGDASFLDDPQTTFADTGGDFFSNMPDFAGVFLPADTSFSFPTITPPQNLPGPSGGGFSGAMGDITNLVSRFYAGVTQATQAKSASDIARARADQQLQTIKTMPNIWVVGGLVAAGFFALEVMDRRK